MGSERTRDMIAQSSGNALALERIAYRLESSFAASQERVADLKQVLEESRLTSVGHWDACMKATARAETAERERDEARKLAYVPGCWVCETCDLVLVRQSFDPTTGEVGIARVEDVPICLNEESHGTMRRQSWREHAEALERSIESVCDERNEARRERDEAVARAEDVEASKNGAYSERDRLVAALSKLLPAWLERHPEHEEWEDDWRWIVFIDGPTGQMTWHIHDSELPWFDHLPRSAAHRWDGHTTAEKYQRLAALKGGAGEK